MYCTYTVAENYRIILEANQAEEKLHCCASASAGIFRQCSSFNVSTTTLPGRLSDFSRRLTLFQKESLGNKRTMPICGDELILKIPTTAFKVLEIAAVKLATQPLGDRG